MRVNSFCQKVIYSIRGDNTFLKNYLFIFFAKHRLIQTYFGRMNSINFIQNDCQYHFPESLEKKLYMNYQ